MTKATRAKVDAYQCTACGRSYEIDPPRWTVIANESVHGPERTKYRMMQKARAEACCSCPQCHQKCDRYMGTSDKLCSSCKSSNAWTYVTEQLTKALAEYELHAWPVDGINRRDEAIEKLIADHAAVDATQEDLKARVLHKLRTDPRGTAPLKPPKQPMRRRRRA